MAIDQATKSHILMRTRAKICGITRSQDILSVVQAGADAIGFVFFPPSPRYVSPAQAQQLIKNIPPYVQTVGLFVNASAEQIQTTLEHVALDIIQFHGDETPEQCQQIASVCKRRWYKALQVKAIAIGKLVKLQHCPRNGNNVKHIFWANLGLTPLHDQMWEGEYVNTLIGIILKSGDLLVASVNSIIHVG